jgi:hypothetical protein
VYFTIIAAKRSVSVFRRPRYIWGITFTPLVSAGITSWKERCVHIVQFTDVLYVDMGCHEREKSDAIFPMDPQSKLYSRHRRKVFRPIAMIVRVRRAWCLTEPTSSCHWVSTVCTLFRTCTSPFQEDPRPPLPLRIQGTMRQKPDRNDNTVI